MPERAPRAPRSLPRLAAAAGSLFHGPALALALGWACLAPVTCAQTSASPHPALPLDYSIRHWTSQEASSLRSVEAILQTRDGFLWLGMNDGLGRFDGVQFQVFHPRNTPALPISYVTCLAEDPDGPLWIGTAGGGLARWHAGKFTVEDAGDGLANEQVKALCISRDGRLWIATDGGGVFVRSRDGVYRQYGVESGLAEPFIVGITEDGEGRIVAAGFRQGPFMLQDGRFIAVPLEPPPAHAGAFGLTRSPAGRVWLGTASGVYRLEGSRFRRWTEHGLPAHAEPVVAWETAETNVWLGTVSALARWNRGEVATYAAGGATSARFAAAFAVDREGSVWTTTEGGGLVQLRRTLFVTLGAPEGLAGNEVTSVLESRSGAVWVASTEGVNRLESGRIDTFTEAQGLPDRFVFSLAEDAAGTLWAATRRGGLARFDGTRFVPLDAAEQLPGKSAWCLTAMPDGSVWAGTSQGAFEYREGRRVRHLAGPQGLSNDDVRAIVQGDDGAIWLGTSHGLNQLREGRISSWTDIPGVGHLDVVISLLSDSDGSLWVGTLTRGLFRMKSGTVTRVSTAHGLPSDTILSILEGDDGQLWLGTSRGVVRTGKAAFNAVVTGETNRLALVTFQRGDGLRTEECSGTVQPSSARGRDGRLWFATADGLATLHPGRSVPNTTPPLVHLHRIAIEGPTSIPAVHGSSRLSGSRRVTALAETDDAPAPAAPQRSVFPTEGIESLRLPPRQERIEFQFAGLSLVAPEHVTFRYRLDGFDRDWVESGPRRVAYYTRVPPGRYTFRVQARQEEGVLSEGESILDIQIEPAWWQTLAFRFIAPLGLLGVLALVVIRWIRRTERARQASADFSRQLIRSQEEERARLANELHDGLGQELQLIRNRAELALARHNPEANLARELQAISAGSARAIADARAMSRGLRPPELDQLGITEALRWLADASNEGFGGRVVARIEDIDGLLPRESELHVYRVVQEALHNATRHSGAAEVSVEVAAPGNALEVCVLDNGRGFAVTPPSDHPGGHGLRSMRARAAILGGSLLLSSQPNLGTRLTLRVPASAQNQP